MTAAGKPVSPIQKDVPLKVLEIAPKKWCGLEQNQGKGFAVIHSFLQHGTAGAPTWCQVLHWTADAAVARTDPVAALRVAHTLIEAAGPQTAPCGPWGEGAVAGVYPGI